MERSRYIEQVYREKDMKTIRDRIFELLKEQKMSQKEFAQRTGIAESSISDWKKKGPILFRIRS